MKNPFYPNISVETEDGFRHYAVRALGANRTGRTVWRGQKEADAERAMQLVSEWTPEQVDAACDDEAPSVDEWLYDAAKAAADLAKIDAENENAEQTRSERAFEDSLNPDNGPSDASYREQMRDAGRGHLLS